MQIRHMLILGLAVAVFLPNQGLSQNTKPALKKLVETIVIPEVSFEKKPLTEAAQLLMYHSCRHDPWGDGVMTFVWPAEKVPTVSIDLKKKTLREAYDAVCKGTDWTYQIDTHAVVFGPKDILSVRCEAIPVSTDPAPCWERVTQQAMTVSMSPGTMIGIFDDMTYRGTRSNDIKGEGMAFIHCPDLKDYNVKEINAAFRGVPLKALMAYACEGYGISCRVDNRATFFGRKELAWTNVELRTYKLPKKAQRMAARTDFRVLLAKHGISFTDPRAGLVARAQYHSPTGKLFLIHTPEAHKKAEKVFGARGQQIWRNRFQQGVAELLQSKDVQKNLQSIVIDVTSFEETPVTTVFEFLKLRGKKLDPEGKGPVFGDIELHSSFIDKPKENDAQPPKKDEDEGLDFDDYDWRISPRKKDKRPLVTLNMHDVPVGDLIRYILTSAGCSLDIQPGKEGKQKLVIIPMSLDGCKTFETRPYTITGNALDRKVDPTKVDYQKWLTDWGVRFPDAGEKWKATAKYDPGTGKVIVHNCPTQHARIDALLKVMGAK